MTSSVGDVGTVALALASAACYGISNVIGPQLARTRTLVAVLVASHAAALLAAGVYLLFERGPALHGGPLLVALLAGAGNAGGLIGFYTAAQLGPLSVVATIGSAGTVVPVAWGLAHGDRLSALQAAGVVLAIGGCVLAARRTAATRAAHPDPKASALWATGSAVAFGVFLTALPAASEHGRAWALLDARAALLVVMAVWAGRQLQDLRIDRGTPLLAVPGLLLMAGTLLYLIATSRGQLSLVSVLNATAPVFTVAIGFCFLGERLSRAQTAGVVTALAGIVLIAT